MFTFTARQTDDLVKNALNLAYMLGFGQPLLRESPEHSLTHVFNRNRMISDAKTILNLPPYLRHDDPGWR